MAVDPLGKILTEIRGNAAVAALTTRIRGGEPAPGDATKPYQRFVVITRLGVGRSKHAPFAETRLGLRCYGTTYQDAAVLYGAVSDAIHNKGPRTGSGVAIQRSYDDTGGSASKDPDTDQPYETAVIQVFAVTHPVP